MRLQPVILAGGSGSRLWPLSRQDMPKQFLPLIGERSLLQETAMRLVGLDGCAAPIVVCNESHRFLVLDQLRDAGIEPLAVVLEPEGRNTAPALALAAHEALHTSPDDPPLLLAMPADHAIADVEGFRTAVVAGADVAQRGCLVTFGITPELAGDWIRIHQDGRVKQRNGGFGAGAIRREAGCRDRAGVSRHRRVPLEQRHVPHARDDVAGRTRAQPAGHRRSMCTGDGGRTTRRLVRAA